MSAYRVSLRPCLTVSCSRQKRETITGRGTRIGLVPGALGPRFLIEAGFIIAVAIVAGVERFRTLTIVIVMAAAWLAVAAVEFVFARRRRAAKAPAAPAAATPPPAVEPQVEPPAVRPSPAVRVLRAEQPRPKPEPPPEPEQVPEEPPAPEPPRPVPEPPRIVAAPPPPKPEPAPAPEPEPPPAPVPLTPRRVEPREWNIWELERLVREQAGADVVRDEERTYLLMYLREFASPDGRLPADFDDVVRETFGDALDAVPW